MIKTTSHEPLTFEHHPDSEPGRLDVALVTVYSQMSIDGEKPGAEKWTADSRVFRPRMIRRVFDAWQGAASSRVIFPWHDDFVCQRWLDWRKTNNPRKVEFCKQNNIVNDYSVREPATT